LWFEGYTWYDIEENNWYISFENNEIVEYYYSLKPSQEYYPWEYFKIQFKDKKLTWWLVFSGGSYDYQTWEYVDEIYNFGLTWTGLEDFKLDYKWYVVNWKEFLTWVFSITWKSFGFSYKLDDSLTKADVVVSWNLDYENILDNLNLNVDVQKRLWKYDYDTWEYEVDDNFSKVFNSKVIINSKNINWQATFYSLWEVVANLTTNWNYTKNTWNLNINVDFSEKFSKSLFWKDDDNHKIVWILELSADSSSNKNNFYIILDVSDNGKTIIKYEIENVWEKYIDNNAQIEVPTDVIELEGLYYWIN
jgi:hypothetical protein